ncbi:Dabb family protein [Vallitalea sediminicola]
MIRHLVMFKYLEEAEGNGKKYNLEKTKDLLENLDGEVEEIKYLHVGLNDDEADESNYDLVLTVDVESILGLNAYQVNPKHVEVGKFIKKVAMARACVDYKF